MSEPRGVCWAMLMYAEEKHLNSETVISTLGILGNYGYL